MNTKEIIERRVDVSADISYYVYKFENAYTDELKKVENGKSHLSDSQIKEQAIEATKAVISEEEKELSINKNIEITHAMYDQDTGVAAIAVKDKVTEETYIAFAGTNAGADGWSDILSDASIGFNNSLHLKKRGDVAVGFYDQVERSGANITLGTGHSYADFLASRMAMERQVPYMLAYQGAPQSVNGQSFYQDNYGKFKLIMDKEDLDFHIQQEKKEATRVRKLLEGYKGYAMTFSSTRDALTNITWEQSSQEISFGGKVHNSFIDGVANVILPPGRSITGITMDTQYLGKVVAIDIPIPHDMDKYRKSKEAMKYSRQVVLESIYGVDLDQDGNLEFAVSPDKLTNQSLIPAFAGSETILLDIDAMRVLTNNLATCFSQVGELQELTQKAILANEEVLLNLSNRRNNLKGKIASHLENINLVEAVKKLDKAYSNLDDVEENVQRIASYSTGDYLCKFDNLGTSMLYDYYDEAGNGWDNYAVVHKLEEVILAAYQMKSDIETNASISTGETVKDGMFGLSSKTNIAKKGENLLNSFESMIEESTSGLDKRSQFGDGIPQAVQEILRVIHQNLQTISACVLYMQNVSDSIRATMEATDTKLATLIQEMDFSHIPEVSATVAKDYNTYLEESGIFDDRDVISAFDNQIDVKAQKLAQEMSAAFNVYLDESNEIIAETNRKVESLKDSCKDISMDFPKRIYYKGRFEAKKEKKFYGILRDQISVSGTITGVQSSMGTIDTKLTEAATTINTVISMLGGFYQPFRDGMEDAFYGTVNLTGIVRSQKAVGAVLSTMVARFIQFQSQLSTFASGYAIDAFSEKLSTTVKVMTNVSHVIDDCFGDE